MRKYAFLIRGNQILALIILWYSVHISISHWLSHMGHSKQHFTTEKNTKNDRNWPFKVWNCCSWTLLHHHFNPSIICCVRCIYKSNLSSLQSLSLFITAVKSIQIGLHLLGLSSSSPLLHFHLSPPSLPSSPPSVPLSLRSTGWEVTWGQLCSCRFQARAAQTNWGHQDVGVVWSHTHTRRWLSVDTCR